MVVAGRGGVSIVFFFVVIEGSLHFCGGIEV